MPKVVIYSIVTVILHNIILTNGFSVCNRTYYGELGKTYSLEVPPPQWNRLPFFCHLTFTTNGHNHGDLVQLIFDAFNIGRYEPEALDGCPEGYMQMSELGRPFIGGSWCGHSTGYAVYYSETSTITVSIKVFHAPLRAATAFEFKIRFKFISQSEAVVRFGSASKPLERGRVSPGTYCTRQFEECYRKTCRLQSPNYPGMYPRNVTCYWSLRQKAVPTCKHAMVSVKQNLEQKVQMKRSISASLNRTSKVLRTWQDCTGERDYLIFYDGTSTDDPVLIKYCGGDWLPQIVSRGPEMLVAFHSSPYSIPLHASTPMRGFELDVDIIFSDSYSLDFSSDPKACIFHINASDPDGVSIELKRGRMGKILSPRHTLPPNTTCTYRFHGQEKDLIWLYFVNYNNHLLIPPKSSNDSSSKTIYAKPLPVCLTRLKIWDGKGKEDPLSQVIADHCDNDTPKMCDHISLSNQTRITRPCTIAESYISTGNEMVIQTHTHQGTALHQSTFKIIYEFVDTRLPGEPWIGRKEDNFSSKCSRVFRNKKKGTVGLPRNVFMYGRGGASNLSCLYRFEAPAGERIRLEINNISFGKNLECYTDSDFHVNRPKCVYLNDSESKGPELNLYDIHWNDFRLHKACICDNATLFETSNSPITFQSSSNVMELRFDANKLNISEDFLDIFFQVTYKMIRVPDCSRNQHLTGPGGEVHVTWPPQSRHEVNCEGIPWLLEAQHDKSLFILTWGTQLMLNPTPEDHSKCPTKNRFIVFTGKPPRPVQIICPSELRSPQFSLYLFSDELNTANTEQMPSINKQTAHYILVELIVREAGAITFNWLEISRTKSSLLKQLDLPANLTVNDTQNIYPREEECAYKCPEIDACIGSNLWCNGVVNCPSGFDEFEINCGHASNIFNYLPGGLFASIACASAVAVVWLLYLILVIARRNNKLSKKKNLGKLIDKRTVKEEKLHTPKS